MNCLLKAVRAVGLPFALVFLGPVLLLTGCGDVSGVNSSEVKGKITYKGTPLTGGTITFQSADLKRPEDGGTIDVLQISGDGTYRTVAMTPGEKVVTIATVDPAQSHQGGGKMITNNPPKDTPKDKAPDLTGAPKAGGGAKMVTVPLKYADPKKSGLTFAVKQGTNTKDWELTD